MIQNFCINCNGKMSIANQCLNCNMISYSGYGIHIYLNGFQNFCSCLVTFNGDVINNRQILFNIHEYKTWKEVMDKINKLEVFK